MKKLSLNLMVFVGIYFLIAMSAVPAAAQSQKEMNLLSYLASPTLSEQQNHYLRTIRAFEGVNNLRFCQISTSLNAQSDLVIELPDGTKKAASRADIEFRGSNEYTWFGRFVQQPEPNMLSINLQVNGEMLTGNLWLGNEHYAIFPLGEGIHVIYQQNGGSFPKDESPEGYEHMKANGGNPNHSQAEEEKLHQEEEENSPMERQGSGFQYENEDQPHDNIYIGGSCKVRLLVAYTDDVNALYADPKSFVQSCIDITNTTFVNTGVTHRVELARSVMVTYAESGAAGTDLPRFVASADGYMDNIHSLRSVYDADLCALIVNSLDYCGYADAILATYSTAFCVVEDGCAVGNLSFPHELGHLYGCRHDTYVDNTNTPYAYGHAYVYLPATWRTVMAYNDYCTANGTSCTRLPYFSNPSITYGGVAMGVSGSKNNRAVLNLTDATIAGFQTMPATSTLLAETILGYQVADKFTGNSITTSGNYIINANAQVSLRANDFVLLQTGFEAKASSSFTAYLDYCSAVTRLANPDNDEPIGENEVLVTDMSLSAYPNPFSSLANIHFSLNQAENVSITVLDLYGREIIKLLNNSPQAEGEHTIEWNAENVASGIYLISLTSAGNTQTTKLIKQ